MWYAVLSRHSNDWFLNTETVAIRLFNGIFTKWPGDETEMCYYVI